MPQIGAFRWLAQLKHQIENSTVVPGQQVHREVGGDS